MWVEILRAACVGSATQYHARGSGGRGRREQQPRRGNSSAKTLSRRILALSDWALRLTSFSPKLSKSNEGKETVRPHHAGTGQVRPLPRPRMPIL